MKVYGEWKKGIHLYKKKCLPYQIFKPNKTAEKIPLVIFLHGSGEAGNDNEKQMYLGTNIGPQYFSSVKIQSIQNSYVLSPQTELGIRWASSTIDEYDFETTPITLSMSALLDLVDNLIKTLNIDLSRIYIAGLSRGGQGVWNAAMNRPNLFAALVPIAGSGSPKSIHLIKHIPTWIFHGDNDEITSIDFSKNMFNLLKEKNKNINFTIIKFGNHESAWIEAHKNSKLWRWMLLQKKN
ncbi:prolyl oligopeptidase family serine peptidase [Cetobacterium sp.]|uniref:carboxylesterase family protein n=1 Tax=Cetobacterium sp. TaxID=2071632 RepID=UPI003F3A2243